MYIDVSGAKPPDAGSTPDTLIFGKSANATRSSETLTIRMTDLPSPGSYNWTVAACLSDGGVLNCEYQQQVRPIRIERTFQVRVTFDSILVRDSCDSISDGEWIVRMGLAGSGHNAAVESGHMDTDEGRWADVHMTRAIVVKETDPVSIGMTATDCDSDGIWTLLNAFRGYEGLFDTVTNWTQTCFGEEALEASGSNDFAGSGVITLPASRWLTFVQPAEMTIMTDHDGDCGTHAYRGRFIVQAIPQ
jgi:hypothetical protein